MSTRVLHLQPQPAAAPDTREPLADAVREVSGHIRALVAGHRRAHARVDELKSADPSLRRSRPRTLPVVPQRPLTIFSFEEADAPAPLLEARRG